MFYASNTPDPVTGNEALGGRNSKPIDDVGFWKRKDPVTSPPDANTALFGGKFSSLAIAQGDYALQVAPQATFFRDISGESSRPPD